MDIDKILRFCAIVDYGSMSKAAETLYCSQPALSKQIIALEKEIGYPLFNRNGKKMTLNENGRLVYTFGRHLEKDFNQLKSDLYALNCSSRREVCFGSTNYIGTYLLPSILMNFKKMHPDIPVNFTINFFPNVLEMLNQDVISFALMPDDGETLYNNTYTTYPFREDQMVVVFPSNHPLADYNCVSPTELVKYPYLISQTQSATRKFILSRLNENDIQLNNILNMYNTETIKQGIINGMGISILSKTSVANEEKHGLLKTAPLCGVDLSRNLYLVHKKNKILLPEDTLFIKQVLGEKLSF